MLNLEFVRRIADAQVDRCRRRHHSNIKNKTNLRCENVDWVQLG
jgi:hypothetical protein